MSDFEKNNDGVKTNVTDRWQEAVWRIVVVLCKVLLALGVFVGLRSIGFISATFLAILVAGAVIIGTFKIGYISRDIKY